MFSMWGISNINVSYRHDVANRYPHSITLYRELEHFAADVNARKRLYSRKLHSKLGFYEDSLQQEHVHSTR